MKENGYGALVEW